MGSVYISNKLSAEYIQQDRYMMSFFNISDLIDSGVNFYMFYSYQRCNYNVQCRYFDICPSTVS